MGLIVEYMFFKTVLPCQWYVEKQDIVDSSYAISPLVYWFNYC